jgi:hypothetical protein
MDPEEVREYARRSRRVVESDSELDEQNTKVKLVQPLIRLLGWDIYSEAVELEHAVQIGSRRTRVDYALKIDGSPAMFVEAKACRDDLSESDAEQLRSYMRQTIDVEWGLLTNGRTFEVLKEPAGDRTRETTVATFDLADLEATPNLLDILTRESIGSGRSSGIAEEAARRDDAIRRLNQHRDAVTASIAEAVGSHLDAEAPVDLQRRSAAFVEDLVTDLDEQRTPIEPVPAAGTGRSGPATDSRGSRGGRGQAARSPSGTAGDRRSLEGAGGERTADGVFGSGMTDGVGEDRTVDATLGAGTDDGGRTTGSQAEDDDGPWVPAPDPGAGVETVERAAIEGDPGATVALVPVGVPGFEFDPDDAFRSPEISGSPSFVAGHVDGSRGEVRYVGRVREIVPADEAGGIPAGRDLTVGDQVVQFEPGRLRELSDPIPAGRRYPRSVRYTDLGSFARARTTDDLL